MRVECQYVIGLQTSLNAAHIGPVYCNDTSPKSRVLYAGQDVVLVEAGAGADNDRRGRLIAPWRRYILNGFRNELLIPFRVFNNRRSVPLQADRSNLSGDFLESLCDSRWTD